MKAFKSESPNGPEITRLDPERVEMCIPVDWSLTAIINLKSLESSGSENITRTAESIELLTEFLHVKASALQAKQDCLPEIAQQHELHAEQLENRLLALFNGALLLL